MNRSLSREKPVTQSCATGSEHGTGGSDRDTWNLPSYLARAISGSMTHLRDHGHGYPGEGGADERQCHHILTRITDPLSADWDRIIDSETLRSAATARNAS